METTRLEAFSDGVFAVAITLLALNLVVPSIDDAQHASMGHLHGLVAALARQWPSFAAYALSFLTILIMWVNHHSIFRFIRRTDHLFLLLNGLLLLVITAMPFGTNLLAAYLGQSDPHVSGADRTVAQLVYSGLSLAMATIYNAMWFYAARGDRLLDPDADQHLVHTISRQFRFGPLLYVIAVLAAFVRPELSLALCVLLAVFFALPSTVTRALDK
jgi:uncharacterized membrane protein